MPSNLPDPSPGSTFTPGAPPRRGLGTAMEKLRHRWAWFIGLGILAILLGTVALGMVVHATITTVYIIAIFMIISGGSELIVGLNSRDWAHFFLWMIAGLLYIVAGAFAIAKPIPAAVFLTLALGAAMFAAGATRIWIGTHMHSHARTMVIVGGVVTLLVGLLIILGWPTNSIVILGTLLGVDLLFTGFVWVGFGFRLRHHA